MTEPTIVIYRPGNLSDTVDALPCFHQIARQYSDHRRLVLTAEPAPGGVSAIESVMEPSGLIHGIITYADGDSSRSSRLRLMLKLRATGARTLIYLAAGRGQEEIKQDVRFFRWGGLRKIIGAPITGDLNDPRFDAEGDRHEAEIERLARTIVPLGAIDLSDRGNWDLQLTANECARAARDLAILDGGPFFVFDIGKLDGNWTLDQWKAVFGALADSYGHLAAVGIGSQRAVANSSRLLNAWPSTKLNLCAQLSVRETAAVIAKAKVFLGYDGGSMHLAAAVGTPAIGLTSATAAARIPFGPGNFAVHLASDATPVDIERAQDAVLALVKAVA